MNNDILLSTKFKSIGEDATVSMPSQIKALFGMNPQIDVRLIDYDYIGDAKDDDYTSFAEKLYKANPNAHYILVTHSNELKDSLLVRKTFHFDLTGFYFSEEIQTWSVPISNNTIVFLGVIEIETFEDLKTAIRFLFSGIYDSQNFLIQHGSTFAKSEIVNLLETYARKRERAKKRSAAARELKQYNWEVPEERVYDSETNHIETAKNHALLPFVQLNEASNPEKEFVKYLEEHSQWIDWWYKNGDKGKQHYAIAYGKSLFYVDFVIRMKNGHVYLFDTKSAGSDVTALEKHNALLQYIQEYSTKDTPLYGGVIIQDGSNWLYSKLPIENTTDLLNWDAFYPENA